MRHLTTLLIALSLILANPSRAEAIEPVLDFDIQSEVEYQAFRSAISKTMLVQVDLLLDERPRIGAVATGLLVFATKNPKATRQDFENFLAAYDDELSSYQFRGGTDTDPDLFRNTNLLGAIRRHARVDNPLLSGFDTRVGDDVLALLGLDIPEAKNFDGLRDRAQEYEFVRSIELGGTPELSEMLLIGFYGNDLNGTHRPGLADEFEAFLIAEGLDPTPPNTPRYAAVYASLEGLPANCFEYQKTLQEFGSPLGFDPLNPADPNDPTLIADINAATADLQATAIYTGIFECLDAIGGVTDGMEPQSAMEILLDDIETIFDDPQTPGILEALDNAEDPGFAATQDAILESDRLAIAQDRATVDWSTLLILQSDQQVANAFATSARQYTKPPLKYYDDMAKAKSIIAYVGTAAKGASAGYKGDAGGVVKATIQGGKDGGKIAEAFSGRPIPLTPEEELFNQGVEIQMQISNLEALMETRFRNIDQQLAVMFEGLTMGFDQIGMTLGMLSMDIDGIIETLAEQGAQLNRIEDALWGTAEDLLLADLSSTANAGLNARGDLNLTDLSYGDQQSGYSGLTDDFFTGATTIAENNTFAGSTTSPLTFDNASELLSGASIGRNINDLRIFPELLDDRAGVADLTTLLGSRVAGSAPWAQSATGFAQMLRESPWYFAADAANLDARLSGIIERGERIQALSIAARDQALFDELFAGYQRSVDEVNSIVDTATRAIGDRGLCDVYDAMGNLNSPCNPDIPFSCDIYLDPFGGTDQIVSQVLTFFLNSNGIPLPDLQPTGIATEGDLVMPNDGRWWGLFEPISEGIPNPLGNGGASIAAAYQYALSDCQSPGPGSFDVTEFTYDIVPLPDDTGRDNLYLFTFQMQLQVADRQAPGMTRPAMITRRLFGRVTQFGVDDISLSESGIEEFFATNPQLWSRMLNTNESQPNSLLDGMSLAGRNIDTFDDNNNATAIEFSSDTLFSEFDSYSSFLLFDLQEEVWELLDNTVPGTIGASVQEINDELTDWVAIIDAYTTLAFPRLMDESSVMRSALRGSPGADSVYLDVDIAGLFTENRLDPGNSESLEDRFGDRKMRTQEEVNFALMNPNTEGHGYIEWVLAELRDLEEHASDLAIDDTYAVDSYDAMGQFQVDAADGLLANDVMQPFRTVEVETTPVTGPTGGVLALNPDGSFTYTPDAGTLQDSFTYQTRTDVIDDMSNAAFPLTTFSAPATVNLIVSPVEPEIIQVPSEQPTIQAAIDAIGSHPANTILVAPGMYNETLVFGNKLLTLRSTDGPSATTISAAGSRTLDIAANNTPGDLTVEGFTITGAMPAGNPELSGAIFYNRSGALNLINCVVRDNMTSGLFAWRGTVNATGCTFENNTGVRGVGMHFNDLNFERTIGNITDCAFIGNAASGVGGAIAAFGSDVSVSGSSFVGNTAGGDGGAIYHVRSNLLEVERCEFRDNIATTVNDPADGGAIYVNSQERPIIASVTNSLFVNNIASRFAGAITNFNGPMTIANCTFAENSADPARNGQAVLHDQTGHPGFMQVVNAIFWRGNVGGGTLFSSNAPYFANSSRFDIVPPLQSNSTNADPMFANSVDYRLSSSSPLIDAGDNAACVGTPLDLDGRDRIIDDPLVPDTGIGGAPIVDMGAYEYVILVNVCGADFDGDGDVDLGDFGAFGFAFGSAIGDANYNPAVDFNNDGDIDLGDFGGFGLEFGRNDCFQ